MHRELGNLIRGTWHRPGGARRHPSGAQHCQGDTVRFNDCGDIAAVLVKVISVVLPSPPPPPPPLHHQIVDGGNG
jgi:hypothetical protein